MPNFLLFFEGTDEIDRLSGFYRWQDKDLKFGCNIAVSKGECISHINDIIAYAMSHDRPHVLG